MKSTGNNIPKVINAYKEIGETPLEVIELLKKSDKSFEQVPITYAGRLDPMAEGVLLLLLGDEVHNKEKYLKLDKEYTFQILFGFSTDTFDLLGRITDSGKADVNIEKLKSTLKSFVGKQEQAYPPYSSKTVEGKPLFKWAREGRIHEIELPLHSVEIKKLKLLENGFISKGDLVDEIRERIAIVKGDFRQKETIELWNAYIENAKQKKFALVTINTTCSSGTYVRALVDDIGAQLNAPCTTFSILRTKVGNYELEASEG